MQGQLQYKEAFILFFQGEQLRNKVMKICEGYNIIYYVLYVHMPLITLHFHYIDGAVIVSFFRFHATLYQCPETAPEREEMTVAVANRINDLQSVLRTTEDHSLTQLQEIGQEINTWQTKVCRSGGCFNCN